MPDVSKVDADKPARRAKTGGRKKGTPNKTNAVALAKKLKEFESYVALGEANTSSPSNEIGDQVYKILSDLIEHAK